MNNTSSTLFDKVWDSHVVRKIEDGPDVFFIDRHLIPNEKYHIWQNWFPKLSTG